MTNLEPRTLEAPGHDASCPCYGSIEHTECRCDNVRDLVKITLVSHSTAHPVGGILVLFRYAHELSRRGHEIQIVHRPNPFQRRAARRPEDIRWFSFHSRIAHFFTNRTADFPRADIIVSPPSELVAPQTAEAPPWGRPVVMIQGEQVGKEAQRRRFMLPCPKICVARWLVDRGLEYDVPAAQLCHIPNGVDHDFFRVVVPLDRRPRRVSMLFHSHPNKRAADGIRAMEIARESTNLSAAIFGARRPRTPLPAWIEVFENPERDVLRDAVYNGTSVFLQSSVVEGFGLAALEAMACGCALVTTDNGGSAEYAHDGTTATVVPPRDPAAMAQALTHILLDDPRRSEFAVAGRALAEAMGWERSVDRFEEMLRRYLDDPLSMSSAR